MTDQQPLVSVLMTAFNREKYIAEAIESVLASTYKNFELIIVDDGSKDETVNIARSFEQKDSRISLYINEKNIGDYPNRNKAATYAKGEFIMYVDSDDIIFSNGLENCIKSMLKYPEANFAIYKPSPEKEVYQMKSCEALRAHLFTKQFLVIGPGGTMIRKDFFTEIKGYPEKYGPANDMYFNLKASAHTAIVLIPFEFMFYRRHEGQEINNAFSYLYNNYRYLRDALEELNLHLTKKEIDWLIKKNKRRFVVNIVKFFFENRNINKTKQAIKKAEFKFSDALSGIFH